MCRANTRDPCVRRSAIGMVRRHRGRAVALQRHHPNPASETWGRVGRFAQSDLDAAVTFTRTMPCIDDALRQRFLALVAEQLVAVAAERDLALAAAPRYQHCRTLGRVAAQRALQLCHILTIQWP